MQTLPDCELEWNEERGILYVHNKQNGASVLRVCGLQRGKYRELLGYGNMLDITISPITSTTVLVSYP